MPTLLSLFDYSGSWSQPFYDGGWDVIQVDIKHGDDVTKFTAQWLMENYIEHAGTIDGMLCAPPCTDFTNSGSWVWPAKDEDGRTAASVHLIHQTLCTVELCRPDFWVIENPVGRLPKLCPEIGEQRFKFDPCDFTGWLEPTKEDLAQLDELRSRNGEGEFTAAEVELVKRLNAYTKKTVLWGAFNEPEIRRVEPVKTCKQGSWTQRHGGKSEATKAARSMTPLGFAQAFYEANKDRHLDWEAIDQEGDYSIHINTTL